MTSWQTFTQQGLPLRLWPFPFKPLFTTEDSKQFFSVEKYNQCKSLRRTITTTKIKRENKLFREAQVRVRKVSDRVFGRYDLFVLSLTYNNVCA